MDIFEYANYRQYLQSLVKNREAKGKTQVELANAMGCQAAYFSQVLKEKAGKLINGLFGKKKEQ